MKKISMKDIARELNISITTVSFVINGKSKEKSISAATVKKVNDLISKNGFKPNNAARILRTGKSKTIGLIVEDIGNYFFGNVAKVIEIAANRSGYNVFYSSTENNLHTAKELINKMKNSSVDGFIITATQGLKEELETLAKENIPFVLLDRLVPGIETNYVILDNFNGSNTLAKHLLTNGYENIGFVSIISEMSQMVDRKNGFLEALAQANFGIAETAILEVAFGESRDNIIAAIKDHISKNPQLDALFFATNYLGVLGIEALQQSNLSIPKDMAVVCFDDNELFRLLSPSISVVSQPIEEIATQSINLLLKIIKNGPKPGQEPVGEIIQPNLIVRKSSPLKKLPSLA